MYWKTLPSEERRKWEEKALIAQAEHRERYPDWRFRPGANTIFKIQAQESKRGTRKRPARGKARAGSSPDDGQEEASKDKGRGRGKHKEKVPQEEKRCEKIVDLLVEGKSGPELEAGIKEWEAGEIAGSSAGVFELSMPTTVNRDQLASTTTNASQSPYLLPAPTSTPRSAVTIQPANPEKEAASTNSPVLRGNESRSAVQLANVPLTEMFKRPAPSVIHIPQPSHSTTFRFHDVPKRELSDGTSHRLLQQGANTGSTWTEVDGDNQREVGWLVTERPEASTQSVFYEGSDNSSTMLMVQKASGRQNQLYHSVCFFFFSFLQHL